jgi:UrcA family protein
MNAATPRKLRAKITALLIGGIVSAAGATLASAASADDGVPSLAVKYDPQTLGSDAGARALYHRLVIAADKVCPADPTSPHLISRSVIECREQSVSRAVHRINNANLVAVYNANTKSG